MKRFLKIFKTPYVAMKEEHALFMKMPLVLRVVSVIATSMYTFIIIKMIKEFALILTNM